MPKDKNKAKDKSESRKPRTASVTYNFFHEKPESAKKEAPLILVCNGEHFNVFPLIIEICARGFATRFERVEHQNREYVDLGDLDIGGVQAFADWAMDHQKPVLISANDDEGNLMEKVVDWYITAQKLKAFLLCDLILYQACKVGQEQELIIHHDLITKVYTETPRRNDALRAFIASNVAYQRRNGLENAITGSEPRLDKQRLRFAAFPKSSSLI